MPFQMAPLDPPVARERDPLLELRTRLLECAVTETSARGPARSSQAKARRASSAGNLWFCATWVAKWEKALAGTPRFPVPIGRRAKTRTERQAKALTLDVVSFDPKLTGARACRDQFVSLFKGEVTTDQVVAAVAEARMQLGDARDDMHAYFSNLADRVGGTALAPFDESLFGYLMDYHGPEIVGVETPAPQAFTEEAERELHERLRMAATDIATEPIERWLDEHFSQEAQRRRRRADFAELGDRYPHSPGRVEGAMQPENHDWSALHNAIQRCIDAGFPAKRSTGFRREWASTFLWLAELATNPDREWRGRGYGDGAIPRSWVWNHIESDGAKRPRFNGLVAAALDVLASRETDQSGSSVATLGTHTPASPPTPTPVNPIQERGLSLIEISILQYLLEVHATSSDRRKTSDEIAKAAVAHESGGSVRKNMSALIKDGHVQSTGGRAGGYWLTPGGVERAVRLKPD